MIISRSQDLIVRENAIDVNPIFLLFNTILSKNNLSEDNKKYSSVKVQVFKEACPKS